MKNVTCGYFSVSATLNWLKPFFEIHSPRPFANSCLGKLFASKATGKSKSELYSVKQA